MTRLPSVYESGLGAGVVRGDLYYDVPALPKERRERLVRVHGHSLLGDVNVRPAK